MKAQLLKVMVVTGLLALGALHLPVRDAASAGDITDLGRPTNDLPQGGHLSYFRHTGPFLRQGRKPELLFIGTMVDGGSAIERWPLVKALRQFGTLSGAGEADTRSCGTERTIKVFCARPGRPLGVPAGPPTYNLAHARYASRYLTFTNLDVLDYDLHMASHLSPTEVSLLRKYIGHEHSAMAWLTLAAGQPAESSTREFPLVSVGGYVETRYATAYPYDLQAATGAPVNFLGVWEFFQAIQQSLLHHHLTNAGTTGRGVPMGLPPATLLSDVNAEANVITALICHADGKRPGRVCNRPVIKAILKHVK